MSNAIMVIGIGGHAVGIDRATGSELWRTKLKGSDYVTVHEDGSNVFAGSNGVLFCLETATGRILWENQLKSLGRGLIAFTSSNDAAVAARIAQKRNEAAVVAAG